jgi:hypothetical protein
VRPELRADRLPSHQEPRRCRPVPQQLLEFAAAIGSAQILAEVNRRDRHVPRLAPKQASLFVIAVDRPGVGRVGGFDGLRPGQQPSSEQRAAAKLQQVAAGHHRVAPALRALSG